MMTWASTFRQTCLGLAGPMLEILLGSTTEDGTLFAMQLSAGFPTLASTARHSNWCVWIRVHWDLFVVHFEQRPRIMNRPTEPTSSPNWHAAI